MFLYCFPWVLVCISIVRARDAVTGRAKSMPTISNSIVNLGKMDISIHFNHKIPEPTLLDKTNEPRSSLFHYSKEPAMEDRCPCSLMKNMRTRVNSHPSEVLNRILSSNDLFSNREPTSSTMCCDSHEHVQEDTIFFEIGPKKNHVDLTSAHQQHPLIPFDFGNLFPVKPSLPVMPSKPKAIEILFLPKEKKFPAFPFVKPLPKKDVEKKNKIQIVGDKELRNDFKTYKYRPTYPIVSSKKDSIPVKARVEKIVETDTKPEITTEATTSKSNIHVSISNAV